MAAQQIKKMKEQFIPIIVENHRIKLGQNGYSHVTAVYNKKLQQITAEKKIYAQGEEYIQAKLKEAENLKKFQGNPYVVQLYDYLQVKDVENNDFSIYLQMELGFSLQKIINLRSDNVPDINKNNKNNKHYFSKIQLYCLIEGILKSGNELHKQKCIHRDIKPDNFLFIPEDFSVKICDFGEIMNYSDYSTVSMDSFRSLQIAGTTAFMSPELKNMYNKHEKSQLQMQQIIQFYQRSDVFSYGLVLLHLILLPNATTDQHIYEINENQDKLNLALLELQLIIKANNYDQQIYYLIKKMLIFNSKERLITIEQVLQEFQSIANKPQSNNVKQQDQKPSNINQNSFDQVSQYQNISIDKYAETQQASPKNHYSREPCIKSSNQLKDSDSGSDFFMKESHHSEGPANKHFKKASLYEFTDQQLMANQGQKTPQNQHYIHISQELQSQFSQELLQSFANLTKGLQKFDLKYKFEQSLNQWQQQHLLTPNDNQQQQLQQQQQQLTNNLNRFIAQHEFLKILKKSESLYKQFIKENEHIFADLQKNCDAAKQQQKQQQQEEIKKESQTTVTSNQCTASCNTENQQLQKQKKLSAVSDEQLIQKIKQKSDLNKKQRTIKGKKIDVWIYSYYYNGNFAIYYENLTEQTYNEKLKFNLTNLVGVNVDTEKEILLKINPKSNFLIKLKEIDSEKKNTNFTTQVQFWLSGDDKEESKGLLLF